jgi:hypothetical protein
MLRRRLTVLVALLGVLLHAAIVVRHNGMMLSAHLQRADLLSALSVICFGSGEQHANVSLPDVPAPSGSQSDCPICSGLVSAVVAVPQQFVIEARAYAVSQRIAHVAEVIAPTLRSVWPPSRAPPVSV